MMFDPPDYPYKELSETYDPENLLFSHDTDSIENSTSTIKNLTISNVGEARTSYLNNNSVEKYYNESSTLFQTINNDRELYVIQHDNIINYEPTLLDENTVNQFLLPLQQTSNESNKDSENTGPDSLALQSCVICHEIFTNESDLLDHTILLHASLNVVDEIGECIVNTVPTPSNAAGTDFSGPYLPDEGINTTGESEWLVCRTCQRVLSTALEVEPTEQLCCLDATGKCSTSSRKLLTMFVCDLCSGLFADGEALDTHRITCIIEKQEIFHEPINYNGQDTSSPGPEIYFPCDVCGRQYPSSDDLKLHSLEFHRPMSAKGTRRPYSNNRNTKMWNCGSCNQLFATARELYRHKRGEDRPEGAPLTAYVCEQCDKVLGSICALYTHKKMHKITKPGYPCGVCGRRFNQSGHLAIHMRMHTGERPYPCDLCPKAFKVKVERDDHRRTHTGERPFACASCPKTFTAAARLREHARIHTDQRPYRCDICGAAFRRPYARTVHTLIHTGEKPHECDICGTSFRRSGDMWKHKRTLHGVQGINAESDMKKLH